MTTHSADLAEQLASHRPAIERKELSACVRGYLADLPGTYRAALAEACSFSTGERGVVVCEPMTLKIEDKPGS